MEKFETLWGRIEVENGTLCIVIDDYELPYVWVRLSRALPTMLSTPFAITR